MKGYLTFGAFLRTKRLECNLTLRTFADALRLSPVHMSNVESDRRPAPKTEILGRIAELLQLCSEDANRMYDLAAESISKPAVSADLPKYIMEQDIVRVELRTVKDAEAADEQWKGFMNRLEKRIIRDGSVPVGGAKGG